MPESDVDVTRLGLVVNPIAGLGGRVGLKGTDGADLVARARALGAEPQALHRATEALSRLLSAWSGDRPRPRLFTGDGEMGKAAADAADFPSTVLAGSIESPTTSADTRRVAAALSGEAVDLLLFTGGDGTARDVCEEIDSAVPALGVPAGVKIQSAVFASSPGAAGTIAAEYLASAKRGTTDREVVDLDEEAYRAGRIAPRLHGHLRVPQGRMVQSRKAPSPSSEAVAMAGIAGAVIDRLEPGRRYILGPGTTTKVIAGQLGVPKTLVGVDVIAIAEDGPRLLVADAAEAELRTIVADGPASIVVTPIGGQGFVLGRGNQPISPVVVRSVGREGIIVIATPAKLAALGGRPLLVDTGDPGLDQELAGHIRVVTGRNDDAVTRVEPA